MKHLAELIILFTSIEAFWLQQHRQLKYSSPASHQEECPHTARPIAFHRFHQLPQKFSLEVEFQLASMYASIPKK